VPVLMSILNQTSPFHFLKRLSHERYWAFVVTDKINLWGVGLKKEGGFFLNFSNASNNKIIYFAVNVKQNWLNNVVGVYSQ